MSEEEEEELFETVPTFHPTLEEMKDFNAYLVHLKEQGADKVGLCKIIPPENWGWDPSIEKAREMKVRNPIQQCVTGRSGVYSVYNLVKRNLVLKDYEVKAMKERGIPTKFETEQDLYDVERKFWKSLTTTASPPLYGSDVQGSLFEDADVAFNVNRLECLLKKCGVRLPGITNPMMYVGMWRSFFPIHTEDVNMFSINVLHLGAPKFWYGVPPAETRRVESLAKSAWPDEKCPELLRHKTKMFSPSRLKQAGIPFVRGVQREKEIMVTWPSSFHAGFNAGFNVAEAVNFVSEPLLEHYLHFARQAGFCKCRPDSVMLDVEWLVEQIEAGRAGLAATSAQQKTKKKSTTQVKRRKREILHPTPIAPLPRLGEFIEFEKYDEAAAEPSSSTVNNNNNSSSRGAGEEQKLKSEWVQAQVVSIVEGKVRLHLKNTLKKNDPWVSLRSVHIRHSQKKGNEVCERDVSVSQSLGTVASEGANGKQESGESLFSNGDSDNKRVKTYEEVGQENLPSLHSVSMLENDL